MANPHRVLTPVQIDLLKRFSEEPVFRDFYLTGGTALAAFYLNHRLSDDLDFFTESPLAVSRVRARLPLMAKELGFQVRLGRQFETLFECAWVSKKGDSVEMDFALDMPGRLAPIRSIKSCPMAIDNLKDIACNKASALYERSEPKDFVDVYVLAKRTIPIDRLLKLARRKYPALDDYGLAVAFLKVRDITLWPKHLSHWRPEDVKIFFVQQAKRLSKRLFD